MSTKLKVLVDGVWYPAKRIGRGNYSKVFRVGDRAVYYSRGDCAKEVMAMYNYGRIAHLPEMIRHNNIGIGRSLYYVFSSPIYNKVTKKDKSAFELMRDIQDAYVAFHNDIERHGFYRYGYRGMENFVHYLHVYRKDIPRSVVRALQEVVHMAGSCDSSGGRSVAFDLHRGNFGVNRYGTLIFIDPFHV